MSDPTDTPQFDNSGFSQDPNQGGPNQPNFTPPPPKKGMGTGAKVGIGCGVAALVLLLAGCVGLVVIGIAASDDVEEAIQNATTTVPGDVAGENEPILFPGRVDAQDQDQERELGAEARISGYTAIAKSASFQQSISSFESAGYVVADVKIENRDSEAQPYSPFDWRLQSPSGQVTDPVLLLSDTELSSGDLVRGGVAEGQVGFEIGATSGDFYLLYKPDPFEAARGVWKVTVP